MERQKNQLERLIENIDEFDRFLKSKGYHDSFLTNAGYPDRFRDSIMNHFYGIISGKESTLDKGVSFKTYLKWTQDPDAYSGYLYMTVDYVKLQKFQIQEITITSEDIYGQKVREETIKDIDQNNMPSIEEAIGKVMKKHNWRRKTKKL